MTYRVYHHTGKVGFAITVTPNNHGQCVRLNFEALANGKWSKSALSSCFDLSGASKQALDLPLAHLPYEHYRTQAVFAPNSKDVTSLGYSSGWFYFQVVK